MASSINADNGVISGSSGLKSTADASGVLALQTNGTTAVTVDTSQNVGVGTTSPNSYGASYKTLTVQGSLSGFVQATDGTTISEIGVFSGSGYGGTRSNSPYLIVTGGSERFRAGTAGQLGIGGANYGTAGQVLTSGGSGAAPTWSSIPASGPSIGLVRALAVNCILP